MKGKKRTFPTQALVGQGQSNPVPGPLLSGHPALILRLKANAHHATKSRKGQRCSQSFALERRGWSKQVGAYCEVNSSAKACERRQSTAREDVDALDEPLRGALNLAMPRSLKIQVQEGRVEQGLRPWLVRVSSKFSLAVPAVRCHRSTSSGPEWSLVARDMHMSQVETSQYAIAARIQAVAGRRYWQAAKRREERRRRKTREQGNWTMMGREQRLFLMGSMFNHRFDPVLNLNIPEHSAHIFTLTAERPHIAELDFRSPRTQVQVRIPNILQNDGHDDSVISEMVKYQCAFDG
ncbi:hypothetical protein C8R43DRAFT_940390 [Mycena crocata]|nr:hypothetical protein C8R43DRAFT_940390 [Mycena crocata]